MFASCLKLKKYLFKPYLKADKIVSQSTCHGEATDKMTAFTGFSKGVKYQTLFSKYISITILMSQF